MNLYVHVTYRGALFGAEVPRIVQKQLQHEVLSAIEERTRRQGRGVAARRNLITHERERMELMVESTLKSPRTTGRAWQRKNVAIIKAMAPRVLRKAAERIAQELGR